MQHAGTHHLFLSLRLFLRPWVFGNFGISSFMNLLPLHDTPAFGPGFILDWLVCGPFYHGSADYVGERHPLDLGFLEPWGGSARIRPADQRGCSLRNRHLHRHRARRNLCAQRQWAQQTLRCYGKDPRRGGGHGGRGGGQGLAQRCADALTRSSTSAHNRARGYPVVSNTGYGPQALARRNPLQPRWRQCPPPGWQRPPSRQRRTAPLLLAESRNRSDHLDGHVA